MYCKHKAISSIYQKKKLLTLLKAIYLKFIAHMILKVEKVYAFTITNKAGIYHYYGLRLKYGFWGNETKENK